MTMSSYEPWDPARGAEIIAEHERVEGATMVILHALQVNMNGGRLPEPESNGRRYLKFPLDALQGAAWDDQ